MDKNGIWKILWYYGKNYSTISKTVIHRFTKEIMVDYQKLKYSDFTKVELWNLL